MEKWLRYTVLPVGQGAGALVQVWEGPTRFDETNARPIEAALIDLGSLGWKGSAGAVSARFVAEQLNMMTSPKLDAVFLSHSDSDHTNLLKNLFEYFDPPGTPAPTTKPILTVANSWFGGHKENYTKSSSDPLGLLRRYGATPTGLGAGASSWPRRRGGPSAPLHRTDNVAYWLLIGNTQAPGDDVDEEDELAVEMVDDPPRGVKRPRDGDSFTLNVVSLVLVVTYGSTPKPIVASGDATGMTLACANGVIEENKLSLGPVFTLSLPHHGSETSTYDLTGTRTKRAREESKAEQVVEEFVSNLSPETITASAAERSTFRHPASRVIAGFAEAVGTGMYREKGLGDEHFFTAHYRQAGLPLTNLAAGPDDMEVVDRWPPDEGWYTGRTNRNVFTIDYTRTDPRGVDLAAISFATRADPDAKPAATLDGRSLPATDPLPPRAAGWGYYVSSDGGSGDLRRLVDVATLTPPAVAALEAMHGPLPPERFVFIRSAPEPGPPAEPSPPRPAVVPEAPRRPERSDSARRPRQLP